MSEQGSAPRLPSGPEADPLTFKLKNLLQVRIWMWLPGLPSGQWPFKIHFGLAVEWRAVLLNAVLSMLRAVSEPQQNSSEIATDFPPPRVTTQVTL